jgi:hypothetical protein
VFVFPGEGKGNTHMGNDVLNKALGVMGYETGTIHAHGFSRVTGMTCGTQYLRIEEAVLDAIMDHAPKNPLKSVYQRATWELDRKREMQRYADWLDRVFEGDPDAMFKPGEREIEEERRARLASLPPVDLDALSRPKALPKAEVVSIKSGRRAA